MKNRKKILKKINKKMVKACVFVLIFSLILVGIGLMVNKSHKTSSKKNTEDKTTVLSDYTSGAYLTDQEAVKLQNSKKYAGFGNPILDKLDRFVQTSNWPGGVALEQEGKPDYSYNTDSKCGDVKTPTGLIWERGIENIDLPYSTNSGPSEIINFTPRGFAASPQGAILNLYQDMVRPFLFSIEQYPYYLNNSNYLLPETSDKAVEQQKNIKQFQNLLTEAKKAGIDTKQNYTEARKQLALQEKDESLAGDGINKELFTVVHANKACVISYTKNAVAIKYYFKLPPTEEYYSDFAILLTGVWNDNGWVLDDLTNDPNKFLTSIDNTDGWTKL